MSNHFLDTKIEFLKGVGPKRAEIFRKELGIATFGQLLVYYPFRYIDKSKVYNIADINSDETYIQLKGKITELQTLGERRGKRLVATLEDETGEIELIWFKGVKWLASSIVIGQEYIVYGKPSKYNNRYNIAHPDLDEVDQSLIANQVTLEAVYPTTELLSRLGLNSKGIHKVQQKLIPQLGGKINETLSIEILDQLKLIDKERAVINVHAPENEHLLQKSRYRLKFEELFYLQLNMLRQKVIKAETIKGAVFNKVGHYFNRFYEQNLPFELTGAQKRVLKEIRDDVGYGKHMNRLLQGDVGSGKTIVALMSTLIAIDNGCQACIMAPTEILANQHYEGIVKLLKGMNLKVELLTGSVKVAKRREIHEQLENGELNILIGTHALIEDKVKFQNLGFVVIDEQHRFGVQQRSKLWRKGSPSLVLPRGKEREQILYKYQTAKPSTYALLKSLKEDRKSRVTDAEKALWSRLRTKQLGMKFRREHIIDQFIVDFLCIQKSLIVEVDGKYHLKQGQQEADEMRTQILEDLGFKVIRFTNEEVIGDIDSVVVKIEKALNSLPDGEIRGATIPPHVLVMTATPIPRTLAMTFYGDLDVSVIDELPPGRKDIKTIHRFDSSRLKVFGFIEKEVKKGRQVYIVYPLIKESEKMDYKDLMDGYESIIRRFPRPDYQISIVHGQMKAADKDFEMQRFVKGETQIMVATTVIEVGVDVPNASVMIIESAERFGLSQLHQLRGRVGRGAEQSYCILMTGNKLSADGRLRMDTMVKTNDGFEISEVDLKLRGPGDIQGTQQSGLLNLNIADLVRDGQILQYARDIAIEILKEDPNLTLDKNHRLVSTLKQLFGNKINWSRIS
ncbi:MAG: ATP-dependent DNA helicase RecG [Flavobacteriales bacterium]|nr:MAG: ATP-dependent DNA helicase RecG [Flavobacteriales bacterium]